MFLALRDLTHAKGRFALIGAVVALITVLVVMLTGLAAGLGRESVSAVSTLGERGVTRVAFSKPAQGQQVGFDSSRVTPEDVEEAAGVRGVQATSRLTIVQARADAGGAPTAVSVFVVPEGSFAAPHGVGRGDVVVGTGLAKDEGLTAGASIRLGGTGVRVARLSDDASYQHVPVVWMVESDAVSAGLLGTQSGGAPSVIVMRTGAGFDAREFGATRSLVVKSPADAVSTVSSYRAENGSLTLMRVMLLFVSALVVGAFFTVWTIQRSPDLAVLKAIGARTGYLVRDAMGQGLIVLTVGGCVGAAVALGGGVLVRGVVPFVVSPATVVIPLASLIALGLLGALVSVRRITTIDPNTALGALR